ncbi:MAG: SIMPL domain-containing protein [Candidatus Woesearchaeota archaeon]|nr:SIMPL domain-containing protein [Candidatus Woesearchaeota archaeon]
MEKNNWLIGVLVLALVVISIAFVYFNKSGGTTNQQTITASGTSTITAVPDEASVYVSINTLEKTTEESKNKNTAISDAVLNAIKKLNIQKDIETTNYNIYPEYDWSSGQQELKGYRTTNTIKVSTKYFDDLGAIVDTAVKAGATGVDSINFELSKDQQNKIKREALANATEDAKLKAEAIANGLNAKLGKVISVTENSYNYIPYPLFRGGAVADAEKAVSTSIEPQNLDITATVNVVYQIK